MSQPRSLEAPAFSVGPAPRRQHAWDVRAAGNFICGGAGAGLLVLSLLLENEGVPGVMLPLAGLALIGLGLSCVWLELGRPTRALHVFFNVRQSWMSREALVATLLIPVTLAVVAGVAHAGIAAAILALAFVYCQSRIVQAARGIPAWTEPRVIRLLVSTGLAEGAGLFCAVEAVLQRATPQLLTVFGALVILRILAWVFYRRALARRAPPAALRALDQCGVVLQWIGTLAPLLLVIPALAFDGGASAGLIVVAGLLVAATGAWTKYVLILRAGFLRGFALPHWPVRGVRRPID